MKKEKFSMGSLDKNLRIFRNDFSVLVFLACVLALASCKGKRKYHDTVAETVKNSPIHTVNDILEFQKDLNRSFKDPETSPLPDRYRKNFEGLDFFAPDTNFIVRATFVRTPNAVPFMMPTTTNGQSKEVLYGIANFSLKGQSYKLEVYQSPEQSKEDGYENYLFLPFLDQTNDAETYSGGRYIDLAIPQGDQLVINFNKAYNPYCAYNKKYSCPIVPKVNMLKTAIKAGVKDFVKK